MPKPVKIPKTVRQTNAEYLRQVRAAKRRGWSWNQWAVYTLNQAASLSKIAEPTSHFFGASHSEPGADA